MSWKIRQLVSKIINNSLPVLKTIDPVLSAS